MLSESDILVLIPAFNEEASAREAARGVHSHLSAARILVVDDGSSDGTCSVAQ